MKCSLEAKVTCSWAGSGTKTHLLSKKARTILDRIGLSSRSGTLLKFSLLGPRKEKHREKREGEKSQGHMSCSPLVRPYFLILSKSHKNSPETRLEYTTLICHLL